jgi:hypothetical protein
MNWLKSLWHQIVVWRTALFNGVGVVLVAIAPLLGAPEILAVIPKPYLPYVVAAVFVINYWMRPRPAVVKDKSK